MNKEAARVFYRQGKIEDATRHLERATELAEVDFHSRGMLSALYLAQGDPNAPASAPRKMIEHVEGALAARSGQWRGAGLRRAELRGGRQLERAREWIDRALLLDPDNMYMRYNLAWPVLAFFDDKEASARAARAGVGNEPARR